MKVRNGFVSNSSSSSFIIRLDEKLNSIDDLKKLLFPYGYPILVTHWGDDAYPTDRIIEIIYKDIKEKFDKNENISINDFNDDLIQINEYNIDDYDKHIKSNYIDEYNIIKDKINECYIKQKGIFRYSGGNRSESDKMWEQYHEINEQINELSNQIIDFYKKSLFETYNDNGYYIKLTYSDNDSELDAYIEHSDILVPIAIQKFNNH